jgi:hypothetical protein
LASLAHTAWLCRNAALAIKALAIEGFGQNTRHRGFANASGASEQISVMQPLLNQGIGQSLHHVLLPHHFGEVARTVFSCKY